MKYTNEYLSGLEERDVRDTFTDGCCIDIHIFDTMHLRDDDDIAGVVLATQCSKKDHLHHEVGTSINFKASEIDIIVELKCDPDNKAVHRIANKAGSR